MNRNPLPDLKNYQFEEVAFNQLMQNRINKVLIVCSNYDFYMLEEDGRIDERIFNEYTALNLRYPPTSSFPRVPQPWLRALPHGCCYVYRRNYLPASWRHTHRLFAGELRSSKRSACRHPLLWTGIPGR